MPSFSIPINRASNGGLRAIVPVFIADANKIPDIEKIPNEKSPLQIDFTGTPTKGLLDTGAMMSGVTKNLAMRLKLNPCGTINMTSASARNVKVNAYRIALIIMVNHKIVVGEAKKQNVMLPISAPSIIEAVEFVNSGEDDVDVLIGMDIIQLSVMTIAGHDNRLTMSF